ncbi:MAG: hypothetical protein AB1641_26390 [Thermodesulfobacteriota bacterium]
MKNTRPRLPHLKVRTGLAAFLLLAGLLAWLGTWRAANDTRPLWPAVSAADRGEAKPWPRTPEYHLPLAWWRADHGSHIETGRIGGRRPFHVLECRSCHRLRQFCHPCHAYVGGWPTGGFLVP